MTRSETATLWAVLGLVLLLSAGPLLLVAAEAFAPGGAPSLEPFAAALDKRSTWRALWNSLESGLLSALLATLIGAGLALAIGLTDLRGKPALVFLILLPMMIPPHVTAIAWIQALGPGGAVLQALGLAPEIGATHPLYSREGIVLLLAIQHAPLAFLVIRAALMALPREMVEAARISGARPGRVLAQVIAPLIAPALIAGFALAFVSALGNFGIQALLGIPARYTTLPVLMWRKLASYGPSVISDMAVIAVLVGAIAIVAVAAQLALQRWSAAPLIGPPQPPLSLRLGPWRGLVMAGLWAYLALVLALPLASLVATALVPTYGVSLSAETLTWRHFDEVLFQQTVTARAFVNSALVAGAAALLLAMIAILLAHFLRTAAGRRPAGLAIGTAEIAYAVPGLVISIAFILAFLKPLPILNVSIYGSLLVIFLAYLAAFLAIALKPVLAASQQLDPSLDDAARVAGARFGRRMRMIFAPLMAPAAASGAILVFLTAYNEVTVSALLWSTGAETIGTTIFNYEDGGYTTLAAAMATLTVIATALLMLALSLFGRRLPSGVIPWKS